MSEDMPVGPIPTAASEDTPGPLQDLAQLILVCDLRYRAKSLSLQMALQCL